MRIGVTGSRYFGGARDKSDLDLFTQDSPEVRAALLSHGFRQLPITGKGGPNMAAMFRKGKVDIGLHRDFERKHFENRLLSITPLRLLMRHASKPVREAIWARVQRYD